MGLLYTFAWHIDNEEGQTEVLPCPMHEEPLKLIPRKARKEILSQINSDLPDKQVRIDGDLDPFCRKTFDDLLRKYD